MDILDNFLLFLFLAVVFAGVLSFLTIAPFRNADKYNRGVEENLLTKELGNNIIFTEDGYLNDDKIFKIYNTNSEINYTDRYVMFCDQAWLMIENCSIKKLNNGGK